MIPTHRIAHEKIDFRDLQLDNLTGAMTLSGADFSGVAYKTENGKYEEYSYRDGILHGPAHVWQSKTLRLIEEYNYISGSKHGPFKIWFKPGVVKEIGKYEYGIITDRKIYNERGQLIDSETLSESSPEYEVLSILRFASLPKELRYAW